MSNIIFAELKNLNVEDILINDKNKISDSVINFYSLSNTHAISHYKNIFINDIITESRAEILEKNLDIRKTLLFDFLKFLTSVSVRFIIFYSSFYDDLDEANNFDELSEIVNRAVRKPPFTDVNCDGLTHFTSACSSFRTALINKF